MSHCVACDKLLTVSEDVRKSKTTGEELGLCNACLGYIEEVVHVTLEDESDELDSPFMGDYDAELSFMGEELSEYGDD